MEGIIRQIENDRAIIEISGGKYLRIALKSIDGPAAEGCRIESGNGFDWQALPAETARRKALTARLAQLIDEKNSPV